MGIGIKDKEKRSNQGEMPYVPERLNPELKTVIDFIKTYRDELLTWGPKLGDKPPFSDMASFYDVLDTLDEDLNRKNKGIDLLTAVAPHAAECSGADVHPGLILTNDTVWAVEKALGADPLELYWLKSLEAYVGTGEVPASVYLFNVPLARPSSSGGAVELQQALLAAMLHRADATVSMGNSRLHPKFDKKRYQNREDTIKEHKKFLEAAGAKDEAQGLICQKADHLKKIKSPVKSKVNRYSHSQDLVIDPDEVGLRENVSPGTDKVRLMRPGKDGKHGYFCDVPAMDVLEIKVEKLEQILVTNTPKIDDFDAEWIEFDDLYFTDQGATPYSMSAYAFEHSNEALKRAVECGNSITDLSFDHGTIWIRKSHVAENGAAAKLEWMGIARAIQGELENGQDLYYGTKPRTEIFPPYSSENPPTLSQLKSLDSILSKANNNELDAVPFYENKTLLAIIQSLGLQNVRIRLDEIGVDQTKNIVGLMNTLNDTYSAPRREMLRQFVKERGGMADEPLKQLLNIVVPELTLQHMFAIGASSVMGINVAVNDLPLKVTNELAHVATPLTTSYGDIPIYNSEEFMEQWRAEVRLGKVSCNIYNVYKLLTFAWRKGLIGAEALGNIFSKELADFMKISLHISSLDTFVRNIDGVVVDAGSFETADPGKDEALANAMSFVTRTDAKGVAIRMAYRDRLNPETLEMLQIDDSERFGVVLNTVKKDLCRQMQQDEQEVLNRQLIVLQGMWEMYTPKKENLTNKNEEYIPKNMVTLTKLYTQLVKTGKLEENMFALQLLIATGMRRYREALTSDILKIDGQNI